MEYIRICQTSDISLNIDILYEYNSFLGYDIDEEKDYIVFPYNQSLTSLLKKSTIDIYVGRYDFHKNIMNGLIKVIFLSEKDKDIFICKLKLICPNIIEY